MDILMILLLFPILWPFIAKGLWHNEINTTEFILNILISCLLVSIVFFVGRYSETSDIEILNGQVTGKEQVKVSCEHSYPCRCRPVSCGKSCTTTVCDTCYDHSHDFDWRVYNNVMDFNISRVDRQGVKEPPRWTVVQKGQSVSLSSTYTNWIKAAPESLFNPQESLKQRFLPSLPNYPHSVYDYHHVDRVLSIGVKIPELKQWNKELQDMLGRVGPYKQVNAVLIFTKETDKNYAKALEQNWLGGKKNDVIIIVSTTEYPKINWVEVISWTDNKLFHVELRDNLTKDIDRESYIKTIESVIAKRFVRKEAKDFEYLKDSIDPPMWVLITCILLGIVSSIGLSIFFKVNDVRIFN